jgi:hypothetical protein
MKHNFLLPSLFLTVALVISAGSAKAYVPPIIDFAPILSYVAGGDIPSSTYDSTPDFTFYTSEGGALHMYGACSTQTNTVVSGNNTITLDALSTGVYNDCKLDVTDTDFTPTTSDKLDIPTFEVKHLIVLDIFAPNLTEVTPVSSPTLDQTPNYTFNSSEAGTITYSGACSSSAASAVSGHNTITFSSLSAGNYNDCKIRVTDASNNASAWLSVNAFTINEQAVPSNDCAGFSDITDSDSDCDAVTYVKSTGAMTGNPNGTFEPEALLQRDQIAKISLESFNLYNSGTSYCSGKPFPDVLSSAWSYQYICRGVDLGMINGYSSGADKGYYRPARSVNRVEFLALILRNLSDPMPSVNSTSYSDVASGQWFSGFAKFSYDNSLFTGSKLYATKLVTRREVAKVLYQLHQLGQL